MPELRSPLVRALFPAALMVPGRGGMGEAPLDPPRLDASQAQRRVKPRLLSATLRCGGVSLLTLQGPASAVNCTLRISRTRMPKKSQSIKFLDARTTESSTPAYRRGPSPGELFFEHVCKVPI